MEKDITIAVNSLDKAISFLTEQKAKLLATVTTFDKLTLNAWIIQKHSNTYYQVGILNLNEGTVILHRPNGKIGATAKNINDNFRFAEKWEIEQHLDFIKNKELAKISLYNNLKKGVWIIQNISDTYYQVGEINVTEQTVMLHRPNNKITVSARAINDTFRLANQQEIESLVQSMYSEYQEKEKKQLLPEFYMITVKGENGSIVRHESFDVAVKEAKRLAESTQHRAHIMGVVAIIEPTIVQKPIIEYQLVK